MQESVVSDIALKIMKKRVLSKKSNGEQETPSEAYQRVAKFVASGHIHFSPNDGKQFEDKTCQFLSEGRFMPNTPTLVNAGFPKAQCSACFVLPVEDNLGSIYDLHHNQGLIQASGGGVGINLSNIRSAGTTASYERFTTKGPIDWLKMLNENATHVVQEMREGANIGILDIGHPDIVEFITCKSQGYKIDVNTLSNQLNISLAEAKRIKAIIGLEKFNVSVSVTDKFMEILENDGDWRLIDPHSHKCIKIIKARELWALLIKNAHEHGEPGILFIDTVNKYNKVPHKGKIEACNPCLRRGSKLLTRNGWINIEELSGGQHEIFDGIGYTIGKIWKTGNKDLIRLYTNNGLTLDITPDHKIYTNDGWVEAKNTEGLSIPYICPTKHVGVTQLPKCVTGGSGKYYTSTQTELMEAFGFLFGDGTISDNKVIINFTPKKDAEFINSVVMPIFSDIASKYDEKLVVPVAKNKSAYEICRSKLSVWLLALGFSKEHIPTRTLPRFLWSATHTAQAAFLRGLYGANGNIVNTAMDAIRLVSTCKKMLQEVQLILQGLGIRSSIRVHSKSNDIEWDNGTYTSKESYHLEITQKNDFYLFNRLIGFPQKCQQDKIRSILKLDTIKSNVRLESGYELTIVKVEALNIFDDVYDFECGTTHMGLVNGMLVHNCAEEPLLPNESCVLGHVNLSKYVTGFNGSSQVNWSGLEEVIRFGVQFLDNVVEVNTFPIAAIAEMSCSTRRIGLGVMGWADALIKLGIRYDSQKAVDIAHEFGEFLEKTSLDESQKLGKDRGNFLFFHGSYWDKAGYKNMRNSEHTTIAPTGQTSVYAGCSSGIEPLMFPVMKREQAGMVQIEYHPILFKKLQERGLDNEEIRNKIGILGSVRKADFLPEDIRELFPSAHDINYKWHLEHQIAWQKHITASISKTINLPNDASISDVENAYMMAYKGGCKGVTVYRDGSRMGQPLSSTKVVEPIKITNRRDDITYGTNRKLRTSCSSIMLYCGNSQDGKLQEITCRMGKSGGCLGSFSEGIARVVSVALQHGVPAENIIKQLSNIRCHMPCIYKSKYTGDRSHTITSCCDAIAVAMEEHILDSGNKKLECTNIIKVHGGVCPDCGTPLMFTEGCAKCVCGYSRCG